MSSGSEHDSQEPLHADTPEPAATVGSDDSGAAAVLRTSVGSGLIKQAAQQSSGQHVTVVKVCPQCGGEYETGDRFCPKDGEPLRPKGSNDPMIGRVVADRYLILARLGEGGMGRVYVAEHVKMNRQCAIKVMSPSLLNDAESTTRFAREASNAARILHPNVAAVFDYGESDKTVYLVMEYVDGESLSNLLSREGTLEPRRAIDIGRQIADGLTAAHELGIVHRDLKPDNVIVAMKRDGREIAKVVDFGIAKAVSELPQDSLTRSGLVIGTPEYMSPEQLLGDPVDSRADIYALGCMLYQMLTGVQPFGAGTREQMIRRRLNEAPPHVQEVISEIPKRLDTLISHMLARSPNERLNSAAAVSSALDPALALAGWDPGTAVLRGPVARNPRGAPTVIRPAGDFGMQPTLPIEAAKTSPKRIVIGATVGSVIVIGGMFLWTRLDPPVAAEPPATPRAQVQQPAAVRPADTAAVTPKPAAGSLPVAATTASSKPESSAKPAPRKPELPPDETAIRRELDHFATAVGNGEIAVQSMLPNIPQPLLMGLRNIYVAGEAFRTKAIYGPMKITGNRAELPLTIEMRYVRRDSKTQELFPFRYRATVLKRAGKWELTDLAPRQ